MKKVLITGGTGLVGKRLSALLTERGTQIHILSRSERRNTGNIKYFRWSVDDGYIEDGALDVDGIFHLAGAGVADKRWTPGRRREIRDSRMLSTQLLHKKISEQHVPLQFFTSASAVGYYGDCSEEQLSENAAPGEGFLADICKEWEKEVFKIGQDSPIAVSALRIGIVLSTEGGALPQLAAPIKMGIGAYLGDGSQYYPWIHIDDLCRMFLHAGENQLKGAFNATSPFPVTNKALAKTIAHILKRPFIPASAPKFILRMAMGEMSTMLLNGQRTKAVKIMESGFEFHHPEVDAALRDIFRRKV